MAAVINVDDAYYKMLHDVLHNSEFQCAPRGQEIREILDYRIEILYPTTKTIATEDEERNKVIADYTYKEMLWYKSGDNSVESAKKISKFWGQLANPDGTINSNYGHLVLYDKSEGDSRFEDQNEGRTPFEFAKDALIRDMDTRQAVMRFNKPKHGFKGNKDFVCTMYGIFHIRNNRLYLSMKQRSADLFYGVVYDIPFFVYLQEKMLKELQVQYPDLEMGTYKHNFDSLHIYERNFEAVSKMLGETE